MAKIRTKPWDAADYLETGEDMAAYLEAAFEDGDPALIAAVLGDIARARGMTKLRGKRDSGAKASTRCYRPREIRSSPQC